MINVINEIVNGNKKNLGGADRRGMQDVLLKEVSFELS